MQLVRPVRITTDILAATNVAVAEAAWAGGTPYAAGDPVNRDLDGQGRRWISAQDANTDHDPATDDGTWWTDDGPTAPWLMFGDSATRQSQHADEVAVSLELPTSERIDTIWLDNLSGTALRVTQTDPVEGVVFDETFSLLSDSGITDWYAWFFEPVVRKTDLLVTGLKPYSGSTLDVSITETGAAVGVGAMILGFSKSLGTTQWGMSLSLKDYSVFAENDFADEAPIERPYKKLASFTTNLPNSYVDELYTLLAGYRATPVLLIGDGDYAVSAVWGFVSFRVDVPGPAQSFCSLDVRSRAR